MGIPVLGRETNKEAKPKLQQGCCTRKAYKFEIKEAWLPKGYYNVSIVIVPDTTSVRRLSIGAVVGYIVDLWTPGAGRRKGKSEDGARRGFGSSGICVIFATCASMLS